MYIVEITYQEIFHPNFHHKLLIREGRVLTNEQTHPSSMIIFVHHMKIVIYLA